MKILFVTSQVISRHATMKRAAGMAGPLHSLGCTVGVLAEDHPDNRDYFGGIEGLRATFFRPGGVRAERSTKNTFVRQSHWDLVHVCGLGWRNSIRRSCGRGLVVMDHVELESSLSGVSRVRRLAQWGLERWSRRYYHGAIGASRWLGEWLRAGGVRRVQHLPYGADLVERYSAHQTAEFLAAQGLGRYALYCGGLNRNYGFWTMLEAFLSLARERPDFSAVLLGRGPEREAGRLAVKAAGLDGRIRLPGFVPETELQQYLAGAAVHVSPLNDTLTDRARCPSKIPMYMMTRRPIVTCRVGEAWEYLGELGCYYAPGSAASLRAVLKELWSCNAELVPYDLDAVSWSALAKRYLAFWAPGERRDPA